jgi:hypothetical protein
LSTARGNRVPAVDASDPVFLVGVRRLAGYRGLGQVPT